MDNFGTWWDGLSGIYRFFWTTSVLTTVVFIVMVILSVIGGDSDADGDAGGDTDGDSSGMDGGAGMMSYILSFKTLLAFMLGASWTGLSALYQGWSVFAIALTSILSGVLMMALMAFLLSLFVKLQHDSTLDMTQTKDLNQYPGVERIYFRHDTDANQLVYDLCQQGRKFLPSDSLVSVVESIKELKQYSQRAVDKTRIDCYSEKTEDEMEDYMKSFGLESVVSPVVGFERQQMQQEWEEWKKEGATRFLNSLMIIPVTKLNV